MRGIFKWLESKLNYVLLSGNKKSSQPFLNWEMCILITGKIVENPEILKERDHEGNTLLNKVAEYWDEDKENWMTLSDLFDVFLSYKADLNVQNVRGETPIMIAIRRG